MLTSFAESSQNFESFKCKVFGHLSMADNTKKDA